MLSKTDLEQLAKRAGCSLAELTKAVGSETEESLSFDTDGEFITNSDLDSIKERAGKDSYKEGKKAGEEMFSKELKRITGIEIEGKSAEKVITAIKDKALEEAKIEPDKLINELKGDKEKLQKALEESEGRLIDVEKTFNSKLTDIEIDSLIKTSIPEILANGLTREQAYTLYRATRGFKKTDNGLALVDPNTQEIIKDKHLNPIPVTDDLKSFINQFGIAEVGRGGSDNHGVKKTNIETFRKQSEVEEYCEKNKIPLSEQHGILVKAMKNEGFKLGE